jgi:release factor glutamine methyltransferase
MKLDFVVTPDVLVPNPDTETLVQRAVAWAREQARPVTVADVGTGSGCIAVAIAHYVAQATVLAGDDDAAALAVADRNVGEHELAGRVTLLRGDLLDPFPGGLDLVCANLPYVSEDAPLPAEVLAQPRHALFAADGGAALIRRLLGQAPDKLVPGGVLMVEIDASLRPALLGGLEGYAGHRFHNDLAGRLRVLEAWTS